MCWHFHQPGATPVPWPALTLVDHGEEDGGILLGVPLLGVLDVAGVLAGIAELHVIQDDGDVVVLLGGGADELHARVVLDDGGLRGFVLYLAVVNLQRQGGRISWVRERLMFS